MGQIEESLEVWDNHYRTLLLDELLIVSARHGGHRLIMFLQQIEPSNGAERIKPAIVQGHRCKWNVQRACGLFTHDAQNRLQIQLGVETGGRMGQHLGTGELRVNVFLP